VKFEFYSLSATQFRIYHQTDVGIGRSNRHGVGWFKGTSEAQVNGRSVTMKQYNSEGQNTRVRLLVYLLAESEKLRLGMGEGSQNT
jgi:hypothetical protein